MTGSEKKFSEDIFWFDLIAGRPSEGQICLRVPYELGTGKGEYNSLIIHTIVNWKGITNIGGAPIPCTDENKIKLMEGSVIFQKLVTEKVLRLKDEVEKKRAKDYLVGRSNN